MNVDTEAPTEEDHLVSTKQGAWGDHLTVQALANTLNVKVGLPCGCGQKYDTCDWRFF